MAIIPLLGWIARFLLSAKGLLCSVVASVFTWCLKSKFFWCGIALYTCVRGSLIAYKYIFNFIITKVGGVDITAPSGSLEILSYANVVVPIDEIGAVFVMLGTAYALRYTVRWIRTAYGLVPFKAT